LWSVGGTEGAEALDRCASLWSCCLFWNGMAETVLLLLVVVEEEED